jgi:phenylpropionate dioxygenase-like ring-hydroxylating dioxygenase large terminal subunit
LVSGASVVDVGPATPEDLSRALSYFWHPVCTLDELRARPGGVMGVRLLGRELVVADVGVGHLVCMVDRCLHRSTRLSAGWVEGASIRCAYHGWLWASDGRCVEIPAAPGLPIPERACLQTFDVEARYGLVWVRLDPAAGLPIPPCPAFDDPSMKVVAGSPYTWPVSIGRRVENFTDLSHFAWVHDGSLGRRDEPAPPVPEVTAVGGALHFDYQPPALDRQRGVALVGYSAYQVFMPGTVEILFDIAGRPGVRRHLWMTASPLDEVSCRSFWLVARNDAHDEPDSEVLDFQDQVLREDEPVVCNQEPELPLQFGHELDVRADRVSIAYRRWLLQLCVASRSGPTQLREAVLATEDPEGGNLAGGGPGAMSLDSAPA